MTKTHIAKTLKECVGYLLQDCEDAGFSLASIHLKIAYEELDTIVAQIDTRGVTPDKTQAML
ncbi:MAG: hypothetical protein AAF607_02700 [Pseudomonadota bacterium]